MRVCHAQCVRVESSVYVLCKSHDGVLAMSIDSRGRVAKYVNNLCYEKYTALDSILL